MKDYTPGLLRHRCSNAMRIGKPIKVHKHGTARKKCPNCRKLIQIFITDAFYDCFGRQTLKKGQGLRD
jgi:hypothetical protein